MINKYTIDVTMEEFNDLPLSLDGEVLLEKTLDDKGNISGYLTISVDKIMAIKSKSDVEIEAIGWGKFKHILNSF